MTEAIAEKEISEQEDLARQKELAKFALNKEVATYTTFEKEEMFNQKLKELNKTIKRFGIPKEKLRLVKDAIESMARMIVEIKDCEGVILRNGSIIKYNNGGGQKGFTKNPAVDNIKKFSDIYHSNIKLLLTLITADDKTLKNDKDDLEAFIKAK